MASTRGVVNGMKQYKRNANGWGLASDDGKILPVKYDSFKILFMARDQPYEDMEESTKQLIGRCINGGSGFAVKQMFKRNKSVKKVLNEYGLEKETMPPDEIQSAVRNMATNCIRAGWKKSDFVAFAQTLDSNRPADDLEDDKDGIVHRYRNGSVAFRRFLKQRIEKEMLEAESDDEGEVDLDSSDE